MGTEGHKRIIRTAEKYSEKEPTEKSCKQFQAQFPGFQECDRKSKTQSQVKPDDNYSSKF
jgi:hypothetical protein